MFLHFEFLFYLGLLLLAIGVGWLIVSLIRSSKASRKGLIIALLGLVLLASPAIYTRFVMSIDLGPREELVQGETHITLTGWEEGDYQVLARKPDTVVLQMANPDVTDKTLAYLSEMHQLRELDLNDTQVSDEGLSALAELDSLESLRLRATRVTDRGFRDHLMPLPNLRRLDLRETDVTAETVTEWQTAQEGRRAMH